MLTTHYPTAIGSLKSRRRAIAPSFVARILSPYRPTGTDYLRSAEVLSDCNHDDDEGSPIITAQGQFAIPSSCYIQSTGHFNAVEYLICFNQLAYTTFAHCVAERILAELPESHGSQMTRKKLKALTIDSFFTDQLSSMLILKTETRFRRFIDASAFVGKLSMTSMSFRGETLFVESNCRFTDPHGGDAEGTVLLAYRRQVG